MNKSLKIRLGKKDQLLKNWWDYLSKNNINISATINQCIAYYVKTGQFIEIAAVPIITKEYEPEAKKYYLPEDSISYKWLVEKQQQGESIGGIIKRVLRCSIRETTGETTFLSLDQLTKIVEQIGAARYTDVVPMVTAPVQAQMEIPRMQAVETVSKPAESMKKDQVKQAETTTNSGKAEPISEYDRLFNQRKDEESEEDVFDFYSLMGHSLSLE